MNENLQDKTKKGVATFKPGAKKWRG